MKIDITKACADSLRAFTQNNYGVQLKSSHAHELVAAYLGYGSRAALLADKNFPISNLAGAEIIILNPAPQIVNQRLKSLNLSSELATSEMLAEAVYAPIVTHENFSGKTYSGFREMGKIWPGIREMAIAFAEARAFENMRDLGMNPGELDYLTDVVIKTTDADVLVKVTFDFPAKAKKPQRDSSVDITLPRMAGGIGYGKPKVRPTFYHGDLV
jgi:hypothetical protein